jgi:hypothetical protein
LQTTTKISALPFLFFILLIIIGSFFLFNVALAVIWEAFSDLERRNCESEDESSDEEQNEKLFEELQKKTMEATAKLKGAAMATGKINLERRRKSELAGLPAGGFNADGSVNVVINQEEVWTWNPTVPQIGHCTG